MVAAYALIVESLLVGILGATVVARAASEGAPSGFELCLSHNEDTAPAPSDIPIEHSSCLAHCLASVAGGQTPMLTPAAVPLIQVDCAGSAISWVAHDWQIPSRDWSLVSRPRGPPLAA